MTRRTKIEVPVRGMDCADCARHVQLAIAAVPGIASVDVRLASEKAVIELDASWTDLAAIPQAVEDAGYSVPLPDDPSPGRPVVGNLSRQILAFLGVVFGAVLFVVVLGEWLGLFEMLTDRVPRRAVHDRSRPPCCPESCHDGPPDRSGGARRRRRRNSGGRRPEGRHRRGPPRREASC